MAKEKTQTPNEEFLVIPLTKSYLQAMFDKYCDKGGFKYFTNEQGSKIDAHSYFMIVRKVYTWDKNYKQVGLYELADRRDYEKAYAHWEQFKRYAEGRLFAMSKGEEYLEEQGSGVEFSEFATVPDPIVETTSSQIKSTGDSEFQAEKGTISKSKLKAMESKHSYYEIK